MAVGTVIRLIRDKGFGFVKDASGKELFFHRSSCSGGLMFEGMTEGQAIAFDEGKSPKGPRAENLREA